MAIRSNASLRCHWFSHPEATAIFTYSLCFQNEKKRVFKEFLNDIYIILLHFLKTFATNPRQPISLQVKDSHLDRLWHI